MTTDLAALVAWLVTAGFGSSLFIMWLARGGVAQHSRQRLLKFRLPPPYFPAPIVFSHILLAVGGLIIWIAYLLTAAQILARVALLTLIPVALFGSSMLTRWLGSRRLRRAAQPGRRGVPESRLPTIVVICHGLAGVLTIVLVLLAAIRAGSG